jgi:hypothetical protein
LKASQVQRPKNESDIDAIVVLSEKDAGVCFRLVGGVTVGIAFNISARANSSSLY